MKQTIRIFLTLLFVQQVVNAQTLDTVSTGAGYANQVWYSLANDEGSAPANDFSVIDYSQAITHLLSPAINTIGYDWKTFAGNTYITNPGMNFIIRDHAGTFYKLHFIDFYNSNGIKGNPKWEMQQL